MCGRFTLTLEASVLQQALDLTGVPKEWIPRYNIAPMQKILVLRDLENRNVEWMQWGLIPSWAKEKKIGNSLINARSETIEQKPSFKKAFQSRRCAILANGFFEWKRKNEASIWKKAYYFKMKTLGVFAFAGIWEKWFSPDQTMIESCAIITCAANSCVSPVHDRMPVILDKEAIPLWLDDHSPSKIKAMMKPYPNDTMMCYPISRLVNNIQNDYPEILLEEREDVTD